MSSDELYEAAEREARAALLERLLARTERLPNGCRRWLGPIDPTGYGRASSHGILFYAHRLIWELSKGPIPEGRALDHLCRMRACVELSHLEPVITATNNRRSRATKLPLPEVEEIRRRVGGGERMKDLAAAFAVAPTTISMLVRGHTWAPNERLLAQG